MPHRNPDDSLLLIRCPSCGQRFKVGDDLRERTVECGGCEHRFRINDEVIVRGRKFYPSERKSEGLNRFHRIPLPGGESLSGVQPVRYGNMPDPATLEPVSPQRVIAGIIGAAGMVLMALFLMFGAGRGGALDGVTLANRFVMAGFVGLLGVIMLVYANPRGRLKALMVGLVMSFGLLSVPYFFSSGSVPLPNHVVTGGEEPASPVDVSPNQEPAEDSSISELRVLIGTGPLTAEIQRLAREGSRKQALGVWLRGLSDSNRFLVRDYMLRITNADAASHFYPRSGGDYLLVLTGVDFSLSELAGMVKDLGKVENVYQEISVVEVRIQNDIFVEGPIEKLTRKEDPAFYELNKRELESIDLQRVKRAVQRLAEADPKIYRSDISRKFISLLGEDDVDFKGELCRALTVWSDSQGGAGEAAQKVLQKLTAEGKPVQPEIVALVVKEKTPGVVSILDELWFKDPMQWESLYMDLGPLAEASVIQRFADTKGTIRYSAVRILGRVGGADSLPVLELAMSGADSELRVLLDQAEKSIKARLGR